MWEAVETNKCSDGLDLVSTFYFGSFKFIFNKEHIVIARCLNNNWDNNQTLFLNDAISLRIRASTSALGTALSTHMSFALMKKYLK